MVRLMTNIERFGCVKEELKVEIRYTEGLKSGIWQFLKDLLISIKYDACIYNCSPNDLFLFAVFKTILPFWPCKLISVDMVLPIPKKESIKKAILVTIKKALLRKIDIFIEYFLDNAGYEEYYGINIEKWRYIPFKLNRFERIISTPIKDEGYIFCGGNTRRDFGTFISALKELKYPSKIVTMNNDEIQRHGSFLDEEDILPKNIEVIRHDGSDTFIDYIANSRFVALPIKEENISASGIGVYLASMALKKCVVISSGPAVNHIITQDQAIIVPPNDVEGLKVALKRAWEDEKYRSYIAENGYQYAIQLKGEERLYDDICKIVFSEVCPN